MKNFIRIITAIVVAVFPAMSAIWHRQATESIRLCAALKQAQSADLLAALQGYQ